MEFKLHTYDIQKLDIAMICYEADEVISVEDKERLSGIMAKLNNACTKENNYTITIKVEEME